jgi:hypothetical protein
MHNSKWKLITFFNFCVKVIPGLWCEYARVLDNSFEKRPTHYTVICSKFSSSGSILSLDDESGIRICSSLISLASSKGDSAGNPVMLSTMQIFAGLKKKTVWSRQTHFQ